MCKVLAVFLPESRPQWQDDGGLVTFYPFLVICESLGDEPGQSAWLPYWHVKEYPDGRTSETKYGQWAPHMDADMLADLVNQAQRAGYLRDQ
jgi:hypothetical protein